MTAAPSQNFLGIKTLQTTDLEYFSRSPPTFQWIVYNVSLKHDYFFKGFHPQFTRELSGKKLTMITLTQNPIFGPQRNVHHQPKSFQKCTFYWVSLAKTQSPNKVDAEPSILAPQILNLAQIHNGPPPPSSSFPEMCEKHLPTKFLIKLPLVVM